MTVNFLILSEVLQILEDQIKNYGGIYGVRAALIKLTPGFSPQSVLPYCFSRFLTENCEKPQ